MPNNPISSLIPPFHTSEPLLKLFHPPGMPASLSSNPHSLLKTWLRSHLFRQSPVVAPKPRLGLAPHRCLPGLAMFSCPIDYVPNPHVCPCHSSSVAAIGRMGSVECRAFMAGHSLPELSQRMDLVGLAHPTPQKEALISSSTPTTCFLQLKLITLK